MVTQRYTASQSGLPTKDSTKSFWHREPSQFLLNHNTTSYSLDPDVVIIGSGISGASAAYHLSQSGLFGASKGSARPRVLMLDAREACWGATGRNGGHCQPRVYGNQPEVGAFELRNYKAIEALIKEHNIPCEWKSLPGCHTYMSKKMFEMAEADVDILRAESPELARLVTVVTKDSKKPSLTDLRIPNAAGAIIQANAASLWPYKFVTWILEDLVKSGYLDIKTHTPATSLQKVDGGWIVHTPHGMIPTQNVLVCTNGYTSAIIPSFEDLIVPVRGEMSSLIPPPSMRPASSVHQPLEYSYAFIGHGSQSIEQDDYLIQRPFSGSANISGENDVGGELMFGGGRSYAAEAGVGVYDDSSIDEPAASYLRRELNVVLDLQNNDDELKASYEWSGIMGFSRDGYPWVGPVENGLWVCGGFTGHGMPNTWLCGKAMVELVQGKKASEVDLPLQYLVTEERYSKARSLDEVLIADKKAFVDCD